MNEKEEAEEEDIEALIAESELYSPIFSCNYTSVASASAEFVSPPCPISPCPSASSTQSQTQQNNRKDRKDPFDETFGGLPFHYVDCYCQENETATMACSAHLDGMVDMQDEDIFQLWMTC